MPEGLIVEIVLVRLPPAGKETVLDDPGHLFVALLKLVERTIESEELLRAARGTMAGLVEGDQDLLAAALDRGAPFGVVDQHLPHGPRGDAEEVLAILDLIGELGIAAERGAEGDGEDVPELVPAALEHAGVGDIGEDTADITGARGRFGWLHP